MYGDAKTIKFTKHEIDDAFKDNRFENEFSIEINLDDVAAEPKEEKVQVKENNSPKENEIQENNGN